MRTVSIPIYNSTKIELFTEKRNDHFEFWAVGVAKGSRVIIDHHLTHNDLEARLEYARAGDLAWREADPSELPAEKHPHAVEMEAATARGSFSDSVDGQLRPCSFLDRDRKATAAAKKLILGRWTDGVLTFGIEPKDKLEWTCTDTKHWLNITAHHRGKPAPNWWSFNSHWLLHIMNRETSCGSSAGVVHVDEKELHLDARGEQNRMVHIFQKVEAA